MSKIVLDASVLVKLYIKEEGSRRAVNAVKKAKALLAPDLLWPETGNILWKYVRRKELEAEAASSISRDMLQMPIVSTPSADLLPLALEIAMQTDRTVYDSLYLALAVQEKTFVLTADKRLANALKRTPLEEFVKPLTPS